MWGGFVFNVAMRAHEGGGGAEGGGSKPPKARAMMEEDDSCREFLVQIASFSRVYISSSAPQSERDSTPLGGLSYDQIAM